MPMQIKRRLGSAGPPTTLVDGQLAFCDPGTPAYDAMPVAYDTELYIGSEDSQPDPVVRALVSSARQVELAGTQTITGSKTIAIANLHVTGATAANMILTATNTTGDLHWATAPSGGLLNVAVDGTTIAGDGASAGTQLQVIGIPPRDVNMTTRAQQPDGSITTINLTPVLAWDAKSNLTLTNFAITRLDDGTY